jgi:hypothetical protein
MAAAVLMKIESEDKKMGDFSMGVLLQMESARQQLQQSQEQNLSQTNTNVQQQGTQAAPKLKVEKLNAEYAKVAQQLFKK